uniref:3-isopropylmalate dehydratase small subunit n=1 Tax=Candidatus Kentrum eta TaxID=2126337 RepID=A0A450V7Y1_9GAMM|nr:MAG: 3-isopropylmalate dehydratase, small subunit [Candidatus Kentron sp. H]VFK00901.1 MAG: 3-isopropylmalate dehydratase, small subunit [Candidatus Kentron sp. H]VFK04776.1 MAG: 3-isopropylmalate dehydratase, small subunit [Candidatus Kentron sp. H]
MQTNRCWKFGEDINTDQILPSQYLLLSSVEEMMKHAMAPEAPHFAQEVKPGDIIVAGANFGCGSSREQAPMVLKAHGIKAVIAPSFGRIYFRNAINLGLLTIELKETAEFNDGDRIAMDVDDGVVFNATTRKEYRFEPPSGLPKKILDAGGLLAYLDGQKKTRKSDKRPG